MKNLICIALATFSLFIYSCKKDKPTQEKEEFYLTADKNSEKWTTEARSFAELGAKDFYLGGGKTGERIRINFTTNTLNQYILLAEKTEFVITNGIQVSPTHNNVEAKYSLDESKSNILNITNYDTKRVIMEGSFTLHFKKVVGDSNYPDALTFTNGKFKTTKAYD